MTTAVATTPSTPSTSTFSPAVELRSVRVYHIHELHNESWYEYQDFKRFCETGEFYDLPDMMRDCVRMDLGLSYEDENPTAEAVKGTETFRSYAEEFEKNPPRYESDEEGTSSYVIVTDMTDEDELSSLVWSMNHHWHVVRLEPCDEEIDEDRAYVVSNRRFRQSDEELRSCGWPEDSIEALSDRERWRYCTTPAEVRESYARGWGVMYHEED